MQKTRLRVTGMKKEKKDKNPFPSFYDSAIYRGFQHRIIYFCISSTLFTVETTSDLLEIVGIIFNSI